MRRAADTTATATPTPSAGRRLLWTAALLLLLLPSLTAMVHAETTHWNELNEALHPHTNTKSFARYEKNFFADQQQSDNTISPSSGTATTSTQVAKEEASEEGDSILDHVDILRVGGNITEYFVETKKGSKKKDKKERVGQLSTATTTNPPSLSPAPTGSATPTVSHKQRKGKGGSDKKKRSSSTSYPTTATPTGSRSPTLSPTLSPQPTASAEPTVPPLVKDDKDQRAGSSSSKSSKGKGAGGDIALTPTASPAPSSSSKAKKKSSKKQSSVPSKESVKKKKEKSSKGDVKEDDHTKMKKSSKKLKGGAATADTPSLAPSVITNDTTIATAEPTPQPSMSTDAPVVMGAPATGKY